MNTATKLPIYKYKEESNCKKNIKLSYIIQKIDNKANQINSNNNIFFLCIYFIDIYFGVIFSHYITILSRNWIKAIYDKIEFINKLKQQNREELKRIGSTLDVVD